MRRGDDMLQFSDCGSANPTAHGVANRLAPAYDRLIDVELPPRLGELVLLLQDRDAVGLKGRGVRSTTTNPTRIVVVVEADALLRELAVAMLEETVLDVVACASAEEAIRLIGEHPDEVAMLFTDIRLAGAMDGVQLAGLASSTWPNIRLVVTSGGGGDRVEELPGQAVYLDKPWRALDVLVQVDQAVRQPGPARS
ncbi:response regulator [Methylobacterium dankookense]|uniref:Response regulatory domain-containing protein n=1 Tax=Methylobacterium dankookense TaxID=560405 RepID=A0A564G259_9HYPH|nr:response regulator [Methylobacterium dankookense]GJD58834.1 hypothetical protein IFDJLNFL_4760 [Methylobacterium dankookense]VUF14194.1 hypothetical protein MTDSW087_03910 [Methylobacterium dankookense]